MPEPNTVSLTVPRITKIVQLGPRKVLMVDLEDFPVEEGEYELRDITVGPPTGPSGAGCVLSIECIIRGGIL